MSDDPYCTEGKGHRCSFSPTGWCLVGLASEACAKTTECVMPGGDDEVAP